MARRLVRYMLASFTAFVIIVSFFNGSAVRERLVHPNAVRTSATKSDNEQHLDDHTPLTHVDLKWANLPIHYPVKGSFTPLPSGPPKEIPKIQHDFQPETAEAKATRLRRLAVVKESFKHSWKGYKDNAWMSDEVAPVTGAQSNVFGGWAATLVDSMDTLWIMDLKDEFNDALNATNYIDFTTATVKTLNVFETTIRYMGGFLAAYDLSGKDELLQKAIELGEMIYVAFDTPNRLPIVRWDWNLKLGGLAQEASVATLSAEIGSLSLELTRLSQLTGDPKYFDAIQRITDVFETQQDKTALPGMWPIFVDAQTPDFTIERMFSLGAMADSLYEYLPKEFMLLGGHAEQYKTMYEKAIEAAKAKLFFRPMTPDNRDVLMSGIYAPDRNMEGGGITMKLRPEGQHLACFLGGLVGIAAKIFARDDLEIARKLTDGCIWAYEGSPKGIMPEVFEVIACEDSQNCQWDEQKWSTMSQARSNDPVNKPSVQSRLPKGITSISDARYVLRPEAIESIFIMYRITGDPVLLEKGWAMFEVVEKATKTPYGHATLSDVTDSTDEKIDKMESFWTAETLKYFYLLFSEPSTMSLDKWVFNTEAHGFKRPVSTMPTTGNAV